MGVCKLAVRDLRLWVRLGCGDEEKYHTQLVSLNIEIGFKSLPKGAKTDELEDTICYLELVEAIKAHCKDRSFNLIERLTSEVHNIVESSVAGNEIVDYINITTHKVAPPVEGVHGGVFFTYGSPKL